MYVSLLVKRVFVLLNVALAMTVLHFISRVFLTSLLSGYPNI